MLRSCSERAQRILRVCKRVTSWGRCLQIGYMERENRRVDCICIIGHVISMLGCREQCTPENDRRHAISGDTPECGRQCLSRVHGATGSIHLGLPTAGQSVPGKLHEAHTELQHVGPVLQHELISISMSEPFSKQCVVRRARWHFSWHGLTTESCARPAGPWRAQAYRHLSPSRHRPAQHAFACRRAQKTRAEA